MSREELAAALARYHAATTEDERAEAVYVRGFVDALRVARHRVGEVLTDCTLGDYDERKAFTTSVESAIAGLLADIEREAAEVDASQEPAAVSGEPGDATK